MPFGQISTHPLRQVLIDLSKEEHNVNNQLNSFTLNAEWFDSSLYRQHDENRQQCAMAHISMITIDANNYFEAAVILYDYFNMTCCCNTDLFDDFHIDICERSSRMTDDYVMFTVDDEHLILSHINDLFQQYSIRLTNDSQNYVLK